MTPEALRAARKANLRSTAAELDPDEIIEHILNLEDGAEVLRGRIRVLEAMEKTVDALRHRVIDLEHAVRNLEPGRD